MSADHDPLTDAFGHVLRHVRRQADLSQEELAHRAGLHRTTISHLERGTWSPSLRIVHKLAEVLEKAPSELLRAAEHALTTGAVKRRKRRRPERKV